MLDSFPQFALYFFYLSFIYLFLVFSLSMSFFLQVLSSVRQKVDSYAATTRNFSSLITKARLNLKMREDSLFFPSQCPPTADYLLGQPGKPRAATVSEMSLGNEWSVEPRVATVSEMSLGNEWSVKPRAATVSEISLGNEWSVKPRAATVSEISSGK